MTYCSILADFQNSVANVQKLCFYLLIPPKDLLDRFEILSDHSQTSRISLGVFNIFNILRRSVTTQYVKNVVITFLTFCVDQPQRNMLKMLI